MNFPFNSEKNNYTLYGALFGALFPIGATILNCVDAYGALTLPNILLAQSANHILWILDSAPFWLGLFARWGGIRQDALMRKNVHIGQVVDQRTRELGVVKNESEFFGRLLDHSLSEIYVFDASTLKFIHVNFGARNNLGYSIEELSKMTPLDLKPEFQEAAFTEIIQSLFRKSTEQAIFKTSHKRKDGSLYPVEVRLQLMHDENPPVFVAVIEDITEQSKREKDLVKAREESEKASRAKTEFLSRMSHELRTPMNAILGFTQLLQIDSRNPLNQNQMDNVNRVSSAGQHLLDLINEVLDLSRIESGRLTLSREPVNIVRVIQEALILNGALADQNGISIDCQIPSDSSIFVRGDFVRLKQVFLNLISNAVKFNKPKGSVTLFTENRNNGTLRIFIKDTGKGIPEENFDKLFAPFERMDADTLGIEGTGIGLTITKRLTHAMGGEIGFSSILNEGSCFYVDFVLTEKPIMESMPDNQPLPNQDITTINGKKRILYIEDMPENVDLVKKILSKRPHVQLLSAANAREGIDLAQRLGPDLILMDIQLPSMDGFSAFEELHKQEKTRNIPVIAVTADAMNAEIRKAGIMDFHSYITKPIRVSVFLEEIDKALT